MATTTTTLEVDIAVGRVLSVTSSGKARVDIVSGAFGAGDFSYPVNPAKGELVLGPYGAPVRIRIRPNAGVTVTYNDKLQQVGVFAEVDPVTGIADGILTTRAARQFASVPLIVTGGDQVGDQQTATFVNGTGAVQWFRQDPNTLVITDIAGQTGTTYTRAVADVDKIVAAYATSWKPTAAGRITRPGLPTAPQNVVATAGDKQATITWTAPASTNGGALLNPAYLLTRLPGGQQFTTNALTYTDTGLTNGTAYTYYVQAINSAGPSPSAASNSVTPADAVEATALTLTGPTTATAGTASSNYTVALSPVGGTVASAVTVTPTPVTGVTFTPTSLSLTTASPSGTFTANAATAGTKSIAVTNNGGLTNPAAISLVVAASGGTTTNAVVSTANFPTAGSSCPAGTGCQIPHVASSEGDITSLVFTDVRTYISDTFVATYPTGTASSDVSLRKYVEYPQGTFTPVLYGGAAPLIMGTAARTKTSDALAITIPAGATWWEHTINQSGIAIDFAAIELPATAAALGVLYNKYASSGNAPAHQATSTASTLFFGSALITGTIAAANVKSHAVIGDSVTFGEGDITGVGAKGSSGYPGRVFDKTGKPYVKFAKRGMSASDFVALFASANTDLDPYLALVNASVTHLDNFYGVNDLRLGRTQSQLLADYQTIYGKFAGKVIAQSTLTNRTSSTDGWITTVNQTQRSDGNWGALTSVNTAIRAPQANVSAVIEASDAGSTARNSNIWPAPPAATLDGTHPVTVQAASMATTITYVPA